METDPRTRSDPLPNPYQRLAAFQAGEANFSLYRSFSYLHSRVLLDLQDEIISLEKELEGIDSDDFGDRDVDQDRGSGLSASGRLSSPSTVNVVADSEREYETGRRERLLGDIKKKLGEYDEVLIKAKSLESFQKPTPPRRRSWFSVPGKNFFGTANDRPQVRRNGLKVLINGQDADAFGDTGSARNIVDENYVRKRNLTWTRSHSEMVMVNGTKLHSRGYVELDVGFAGENEPATRIVAWVVKRFPFDLLLSHTFLETTQTLKKHLRRFTRILFPRLTASLSMNFLAGSAKGSLFNASFDNGIDFDAVLDTGSNCNAVDELWAIMHNLIIHRDEDHCGWISLPSNESVPTVGRVYTDMNLPDGTTAPISLEVLKDAKVPVIIGIDTILDHELFTAYPEALLDRYEDEAELFHMNFKSSWLVNVVAKAKQLFTSPKRIETADPVIRQSEAERRWAWDKKFQDGKTAPRDEWEKEYITRYQYERAKASGNGLGINVRLIKEFPLNHAS